MKNTVNLLLVSRQQRLTRRKSYVLASTMNQHLTLSVEDKSMMYTCWAEVIPNSKKSSL